MTYSIGVGADSAFTTGLHSVAATDTDGVGMTQTDDRGNIFRFIKNVDSTAFVVGQPVCYDSAANKGTSAYRDEATRPVTAELMNAAGICVTAIGASGANAYGWVQIYGLFKNARVLTPATGGDDIEEGSELITANTGLNLVYQGNAGTGSIYSQHFRALEVVATATGAAVVNIDVAVYCL